MTVRFTETTAVRKSFIKDSWSNQKHDSLRDEMMKWIEMDDFPNRKAITGVPIFFKRPMEWGQRIFGLGWNAPLPLIKLSWKIYPFKCHPMPSMPSDWPFHPCSSSSCSFFANFMALKLYGSSRLSQDVHGRRPHIFTERRTSRNCHTIASLGVPETNSTRMNYIRIAGQESQNSLMSSVHPFTLNGALKFKVGTSTLIWSGLRD